MATVRSLIRSTGATVVVASADGSRWRNPVARADRTLSAVVLALLVIAAVAGLLVDGLYQESDAVAAMFRGYDLITLLVAAPTLAATLLPTLRTSGRAHLLRAGMLAYAVHTYAYYVFGMAFNAVFLIHVATFSVSLFALWFALTTVDVARLAGQFRPRTPVRVVAAVLTVLAVSLAAMWIVGSLQFAFTGRLRDDGHLLVSTTAFTHLGYVMDLAVLVPVYLLAGVLLWRRHPWGYVLGTVMLVAGFVTQLTYMAGLGFQARAGVAGATAFDPFEPVIVSLYVIAAGLPLVNMSRLTPASASPSDDLHCR